MHSIQAEYLLIGGYAVNYYGYPRATADLDRWIAVDAENANKIASVLKQFGLSEAEPELFLELGKMVRLGVPLLRIEFVTKIAGVSFAECYAARLESEFNGLPVKRISLEHRKQNKMAAGRLKD